MEITKVETILDERLERYLVICRYYREKGREEMADLYYEKFKTVQGIHDDIFLNRS